MGVIPDRYASETYSRKFAERTGADVRRLSFGPALYGPSGLDIRGRVLMYRISKQIQPQASPEEHAKFINQLGNYVRGMQGEMERAVKESGLAPFYTAGSTMWRNGINAWLGTTPMPKTGRARRMALRIGQLLSGGAIGVLTTWILAHKAYTGKWPWEDDRTRLLQIPLNPKDRASKAAQVIYGPGDRTAYVGFGFFNPIVERGARTLGVRGTYDVGMLTRRPGQAAEHGEKDVLNSLIHPFTSGPAFSGLAVMATGREPRLTGLRDPISGRLGPQFPSATSRAAPGLPTATARVQEGVLNMNSFFQDIAAGVGFGHQAQYNERMQGTAGEKALRMTLNIAAPRLIKGTGNVDLQIGRLDAEFIAASRAEPDLKLVPAPLRRSVGAALESAGVRLPSISKHITSDDKDGKPETRGRIGITPIEIPDQVFGRYRQELTKRWYETLAPLAADPSFRSAPREEQKRVIEGITEEIRDAEWDRLIPRLMGAGAKMAAPGGRLAAPVRVR